MRNGCREVRATRTWRRGRAPLWSLALCLAAAACGCAPTAANREQLIRGYAAFEQKKYDDAIAASEEVLATAGSGFGAADALYLQGRALEEKAEQAAGPAAAREHLQAARGAYTRALVLSPPPMLDAYVRAGLANAAYHQEDYATAAREWRTAFPNMDRPDTKAWILYRAALSDQRLGRFAEADRTFAEVQRQFPGTQQAGRAQTHQGARAFHVQIGIYASAANAENAIASLRTQGFTPVKSSDAAGRQIVGVGPLPTYPQAKSAKSRLVGQYPEAIIVP